MRIIAGRAKGRRLRTPRHGTRPLTARAREALFSSLGDRVTGASVLDLYAGSGSLGLEALSRGAATAVFVERGREAIHLLRENVAAVALGGRVVARDVSTFLAADGGIYDVAFVDPPYADPPGDVDAVLAVLSGRISPGGTVVVHRRTGDPAPAVEFPSDARRRRYGDATLYLFHRDGRP